MCICNRLKNLLHCKLSILKFRVVRLQISIMSIEFVASGLNRELPGDFDMLALSFGQESQNLAFQLFESRDAPIKT